MNSRELATLIIAGFIVTAPSVQAQSSGKRPIRSIVASSPGGPSDVQMRLLAPKMGEMLGQTIVVDNRPSANGVLGAQLCANAVPDGLTICVGNSGTHAINGTLYRKLPYNITRDFQPISMMGTTGLVVAVNPKIPAGSLQAFAELAKKQPGRITVGVAGATGQFAGDALWKRLGMSMINVNYKGSAPTELSLLSGEINCALLTPLASTQHLKSGRMKALGVTGFKRAALLPDLPTVAELGVKGYAFEFWNGIFAPAGTSPAIVKAIHQSMVHALNTPQVRDRLAQLGFTPGGQPPAEYTQFVKEEVEKFRKQIIASGVPLL
jgi:tripartite-type tricarboxylate transporter receptor subunit TctC